MCVAGTGRAKAVTGLSARALPVSALPVVDVGDLESPEPARRLGVAAAIRAACLGDGFFYIENHDVPAGLIEAAFDEARKFFALPDEAKDKVSNTLSFCERGHEPMGGQDLERVGTPDLKEAFDMGVELALDDPRVIARKVNHGPNQWPAGLPQFRPVMEDYFRAAFDLALRLMQSLALSLELPEDHFAEFCAEAVGLLRLLHYPRQPVDPRPGEKGAGAHTDLGAITLLLQDEAAGLQIWDRRQGWVHAPPRPGAYIVNLGDLMARFTNDRYRSTRHRVVNVSGRDRYSIPFFLDGNPDYLVSCLSNCLAPGERPHYAPVTVADHTRPAHHAVPLYGPT